MFAVLSLPITLVSLALNIPFGGSPWIANLGIKISAEASPPGQWSVVQLPPSPTSLELSRGLSHATHSDPLALRVLGRWFSRSFAAIDTLDFLHEEGRTHQRLGGG